jgi:hypothetical protein
MQAYATSQPAKGLDIGSAKRYRVASCLCWFESRQITAIVTAMDAVEWRIGSKQKRAEADVLTTNSLMSTLHNITDNWTIDRQ